MISSSEIKRFLDHLSVVPSERFKNLDQEDRKLVQIILDSRSTPASLTSEQLAAITRKVDSIQLPDPPGVFHEDFRLNNALY